MRAKIHRLTTAKNGNVDASDYGPEQVLDSEAKTGMRPISRRAYKKGGKVVAVSGADAKQNAGKKARAGKKPLSIDALVNRNLKDANESREGKKHVGGFKSGGRTKKQYGGMNGRPTEEHDTMNDADLALLRKSAAADAAKTYVPGRGPSVPPPPKPMPKQRKHGGEAWEGSAKDEAQDKKMAKKYGMSMSAWEKSSMDKKHDTQHSTKGLKKGGRAHKNLGGVLKDVGKYGAIGLGADAVSKNPSILGGGLGALAMHLLDKKKDAPGASTASATPAVAGKKRGGGLYANIHAKQERIAHGSKEHMRKAGSKGAPTADAFEKSARTAKAHGGFTSLDGEFQTQQKVTGRHAKMHGGSLSGLEMNKGGRAKGKTNINIVIATGKGQQGMQPDMPPPPGPQGVPVPMPASPPPQAGAPMPMPMPMPPMGGPGAGPAPMPRKAGGRTYRSYKDMDAGAGSGEGRLEKTEIQKHKK
jgi:hypothetical protein